MSEPRTLSTVARPTIDLILRHDLPHLPVAHRKTVTNFTIHRLDTLPQHLFWGVGLIAFVLRIVSLLGGRRLVVWASHQSLPVVSEFFRLVRSLSYSFIWESWPDTAPDGRLAEGSGAAPS